MSNIVILMSFQTIYSINYDITEQTLQAPPGLKDTLRQVFREILVSRGEPFSKVVLKEIVIKIFKTRHTNCESLCLNF